MIERGIEKERTVRNWVCCCCAGKPGETFKAAFHTNGLISSFLFARFFFLPSLKQVNVNKLVQLHRELEDGLQFAHDGKEEGAGERKKEEENGGFL